MPLLIFFFFWNQEEGNNASENDNAANQIEEEIPSCIMGTGLRVCCQSVKPDKENQPGNQRKNGKNAFCLSFVLLSDVLCDIRVKGSIIGR